MMASTPLAAGSRASQQQRRRELILVLGLCALFFFARLQSFGLLGADEPRYAQVAHEMMERGNWITPVLYGQPWLEKPVAYYWGAIASYKLFGVSDAAARFPVALISSLMVLFVFFVYKKLRPEQSVDAAVMTASSALVAGLGRAASTDMMLAAPLTIALLSWFVWYEKGCRCWLALAYAALGVAALAKGPVAPGLAFLVVLAFCAARREWKKLTASLWPVGLLVFFVVALPWYAMVQHQTPQFFRVFFLEHNLARFGSNAFGHRQPFWYYLPVLLAAVAPWTVMAVAALADGFVRLRKELQHPAAEAESALPLFLFLWTAVPVLFFSLSQSKLPGYILPAIPPAMLLACGWLRRRAEEKRALPFCMTLTHAALLAMLAAGVLVSPALLLHSRPQAAAIALAAVAALLVFGAVAAVLRQKSWERVRYATLVPFVLIFSLALLLDGPLLEQTQSARPVAHLLHSVGVEASEPVYTFHLRRETNFGLGFYRNSLVNAYEGLEISPGQRRTPTAVPMRAHVLLTRAGREAELTDFFAPGQWSITPLGTLPEQHLVVLRITPIAPER